MTIILFAGGDIRVAPELPDPSWGTDRRERYLLRPEISRPLSVDRTVWPAPDRSVHEVDHPLPWIGVEAVRRRWMSSQGGNGDWALVAIGTVAADAEAREHLARHRGIDSVLDVGPAWRLLGYDVADEGNISGLSNCGFGEDEMVSLRATWASRINDYGLMTNLSDALSFRSITDRRVSEHAPFQVYALWLVP